ncbi:ttm-5 [Pristionchus pacificus]|uniref:sphingolipid 4-desaturase n=1 Tax=Pristionchus pacificus TaxID=54126 RepID=A0A2A6CT66_PRIPA|nr:ttm-5 [Pristionchus pacificus]|eukprot:PDM81412.1 ttm-5 [Pristionchus pacificus]
MGGVVSRDDFMWTYDEQPHTSRRKEIVKKYPQIKELFGVDPSLKWVIAAMVAVQVFFCWLLQNEDWLLVTIMAYCCGGVINHALTLAIHDISHNTAFGQKRSFDNRVFGIFTNLPIGIPISVAFKKYHVEHHRYLGEDGLDTDVPTEFEAKFFTSPFRKFVWLILQVQPLFYGLRPLIIYNKLPNDLEILNFAVQIAFDLVILYAFGIKALFYLIFGTLIAMGVHPSAGHFISEHYVFTEGQETYSYYGPWNLCTFNVGYHMEHHDFPYVPSRSLPALRAMAPEYYASLDQHQSWTWVLYSFVIDPKMGPYARHKRVASAPQVLEGRHILRKYWEGIFNYFAIPEISRWISSCISAKKTD